MGKGGLIMSRDYRITHNVKGDETAYIVTAKNALTAMSQVLMYWTGNRFSLDVRDAKKYSYAKGQKQLYHRKISSLKSRGFISSVRMEEAR